MTNLKDLTIDECIARDEEFLAITGETLGHLSTVVNMLGTENVEFDRLVKAIEIEREVVQARLDSTRTVKVATEEAPAE